MGFVANQPRRLGGVLDSASAQKAARFVRTCDSFGLPLVVLVDTPGFLPGVRQERDGVLRHGATLLHAFAGARVPRLTVVLRKAFGGGCIAMNSRALGADLVLAWPDAQIGVLGAKQAVDLLHRRELAAADDRDAEAGRLQAAYTETHLGASVAARDGHVDEVVEPGETRDRLAWALRTLGGCAVITSYVAVGDSFSAGIPGQTPWPDLVARAPVRCLAGAPLRELRRGRRDQPRRRRPTSSAPRSLAGPT